MTVETLLRLIRHIEYYQVVDATVTVETDRQSFTVDATECEAGVSRETYRPFLTRGAGTIYVDDADTDDPRAWLDEMGATPDPVESVAIECEVTADV